MSNSSALALWRRYRLFNPHVPPDPPLAEHFCDNQLDADHYANLVREGRKRATASALIEYAAAGEMLPEPGKLVVITDWSGQAKAISETMRVTVCRFGDVTASFAALEGEGDGSLTAWRTEHRSFWRRNLADRGCEIDDDFQVVCEEFDVVLIA